MDDRTTSVLDALDPIGAALLVELLAGPATEGSLIASLATPSQPTANRRLDKLKRARIVAQEPGKPHAPGRLWAVVHPAETEALLAGLFGLSEAIDLNDRARRAQAQRKLKRARAARLGIRDVGAERQNR